MSNLPRFTSDLHVDHKNIIEYSNRPWTLENQEDEIVSRWNDRVGKDDEVYHLGDFVFAGSKKFEKVASLIRRLNGKIHFIRGNHCQKNLWSMIEAASGEFAALPNVVWVKDYHEMSVQGQSIILCHYPMEVWNHSHRGSWMLHGHCHGSLPSRGKRLDVGIDNHPDRQVFTYEEICDYMAKQPIAVMDHHDGGRD